MKWFLILAAHFLRSLAVLLRSGGSKTLIAQRFLLKHQILMKSLG